MEPYIAREIKRNYKEQYNDDDINFLIWMTNIEKIVYNKLNAALDEIPDEDYRLNYENKITYEEMAKIVIKNNRYY